MVVCVPVQIRSIESKSIDIWLLVLPSSSAKKDSSNLVALCVQCGKYVPIVDLTSAIGLPATRNLSNLKGDVLVRKTLFITNLDMSYDGMKVFDVPGDVALDLLQVEDVQLKPQPWRVKVLDKLDSVLVVVHVVVGHAVRVDRLNEPNHLGCLEHCSMSRGKAASKLLLKVFKAVSLLTPSFFLKAPSSG